MIACAISDSMAWLPWIAVVVALLIGACFGFVAGGDRTP